MTRGRIGALAALVVVIAGLLVWRALKPERAGAVTVAADSPPPAPAQRKSAIGAALPPPERSTLADALNSPATDIRADLKLVGVVVETFRSNFLSTGNPVGSNAEITAALTGRNPLRLALIPADHPAINAQGELCDRWGTPFFFHAESATRMEIRSAGPDRKLWNDDDVVQSP